MLHRHCGKFMMHLPFIRKANVLIREQKALKDHIIYKKKIHTWAHKDVMSFIAHKGNVTKQQNNYKNDLTIMMTISVHAPFVSTSRPSVEPGVL
ncbi:hypothetical protein P3S67_015288 [Capsicum chacoense]